MDVIQKHLGMGGGVENEVFLRKVIELERFCLETSAVDAKYSKLNYSIYTFSSFFGLLDKTE